MSNDLEMTADLDHEEQAESSIPQILYDRSLVWLALGLMLSGLVMVTSASFPVGIKLTGDAFYFMERHAIFLVLSLFTIAVVLQIPIHIWLKYSVHLMLVSMLLLIFVLVIGHSAKGAARWISFGLFRFQPAEVAKLSLFVFMSGYLYRKQGEVQHSFFGGFIKPIIVFALFAILLLAQPDFGTVVVMLVTLFGLLFIAGANIWQFLSLIVVGGGAVVTLIIIEPYRMRRVTSFWHPFDDPFGSGYQLTQSLMAFGRGDWFGQGLGNSIQKLEYLPEAHTDFVVSILAEELGFAGIIMLLLMLYILVLKAFMIGKKSLESGHIFGGFLSFSLGFWFAFQTIVNIGGAAGMVPTKGLTLPLISYGGSSLIIMSVAIALLLRIDFEYRVDQYRHLE